MATREEQLEFYKQQRDYVLAELADPNTPEYAKPALRYRIEFLDFQIKSLELG